MKTLDIKIEKANVSKAELIKYIERIGTYIEGRGNIDTIEASKQINESYTGLPFSITLSDTIITIQ